MNKFADNEQHAFDYVTGILRGAERNAFRATLQDDEKLQQAVHFWEEKLMAMSNAENERKPHPNLWQAIEQQLNQHSANNVTSQHNHWRKKWLWLTIGIAANIAIFCIAWLLPLQKNPFPNMDYVAVLTNTQGNPLLTALTGKQAKTLWLKWEVLPIAQNKNLQLWAISRRDGQTRSLAVFEHTRQHTLALSDAHLHLIRDAAFLLLTEEEIGGSSIDEPSETIIAKGACIFFDKTNNTL